MDVYQTFRPRPRRPVGPVGAVIVVTTLALLGICGIAGASGTWTSRGLPFSVPGPVPGTFSAVSCSSSTSCLAVGQATLAGSNGDTGMLVATLVSGSWAQSMLPAPAGATSASLAGVDCSSATVCTAVGRYVSGQSHALVERLSGTKWKATRIDPAGASAAGLSAVSCSSATSCVAVGTASGAGLVEQLAHGHWKAAALALPAGTSGAGLSGVSCLSPGPCVAVGSVTESSGTAALMEARMGTSWTPTVDSSVADAELSAVSCVPSGNCEAVGGGTFSSLVESGQGTTWTATAAAPGTHLSSVWCDPSVSGSCTAWGILYNNSAVIDSLSAGTWSQESGPPEGSFSTGLVGTCFSATTCVAFNQGNADPAVDTLTPSGWTSAVLSGTPDATFDQVSCSADICVALGTYDNDAGARFFFVETLVAGHWQLVPGLTSPLTNVALPSSVSCAGDFCAVVGAVDATTSDGVHWTDFTLPVPSGDTTAPAVDSVSCVSSGACLAVGTPAGMADTLVADVLQSGTWSAATIPDPSGTTGANLASVSCSALDACTAVGSADGATGIQSLVEVLAGTTWTGTVLPPAPSSTYGDLASVSCPTSSSPTCVAVGSAFPSYGGIGEPLVESLSSGTWTPTTQVPLSGTSFGTNESVSCPTAGTCHATQLDEGSTGSDWQLETLSAGTWSADPVPAPTGSAADSPVAVSCGPAPWCTVAGSEDSPFSPAMPDEAVTPMIATLGAPAPSITSADAATVTAGTPFTFTVRTGGSPTAALSESGALPAGLTFTDNHDGTATMAGTTAVKKGSHPVTVTADNGLGPVATQTLTLTCTH